MSRVDIAELRRLHEAATKDAGEGEWGLVEDHDETWTLTNGNGNCLAGDICYQSVAEFLLAAHNALPALLDEMEAAREMTAFAETYGELVQLAPKVAGAVVGHEWDNMRPVEQKRWLLAELSAARETICRLSQANADLRKERDRAVAEAQRQDVMAKGLRKELRQLFEQQHHMKLIGAADELERLAKDRENGGLCRRLRVLLCDYDHTDAPRDMTITRGLIEAAELRERAAQLRREAEDATR